MGNGQVERFNQTLLQMLGTLEDHQKSDRKAHIPVLVHVYNATFHDSTGYSPYFLMFGRHPRQAIDAFLGLNSDSLNSMTQTIFVMLDFKYWNVMVLPKLVINLHILVYPVKKAPTSASPN